MVQAIFQWLNNDSTADLNLRFASVFKRGIASGGEVLPVTGEAKVTVNPFLALSNDGLLVKETEVITLDIPLNQSSVVAIKAKWVQAGDAVTEYAVIESSIFHSLTDKEDYIVFGSVNMNSGDLVVTNSNIELSYRDMFDRLGRSSFRGWFSSLAEIPTEDNRPGDFWMVNEGSGDLAEIYAWNGVSLLNITNTLSLQNQLTSHRNNVYSDEIHLTDLQADAALGSAGIPAGDNRYVTEQDPRLPTQSENDAIEGSHGTPSSANKFITESYPLAETTIVTYSLPPGVLTLINAVDVFVGKGVIGSAGQYFALMDVNSDRGYINTSGINPKVSGIYKNALLSAPLNPSSDADSDGFYSGDLYITVDAIVDTGVRLAFGTKSALKTVSKGFDVTKGPASDYVSGDLMMHVQNIKGRPYDELLPTDESNKELRGDIDNLISYLGSHQDTSIVTGDEDYNYFSNDPKLGEFFVKNAGVSPIKTFSNNDVVSFSYNSGLVTYSSSVNLSSVGIGDLFRDGNGDYFRVTAKSSDTLNIVNIDNGLVPNVISTSAAQVEDGSVYVNNNPRNILVSELKVNNHEIVRIGDLYRLKEFSRPEGRAAYGVLQFGKRIDPRLVLYGSWERKSETTGEIVVKNSTSIGDIAYTGFFSHLFLLVKSKPGSPNIDVSINNRPVAYSVSTSASGSVEPTVADIAGIRYHRIPLVVDNDPSVLTHVNGKIQGASVDPLYLAGVEVVTVADNRNNKFIYSEQFDNAAWTKTFATVSPDLVNSPTGDATADKLVESATTSQHKVSQSYTFENNKFYTVSVFAKAAERSVLAIDVSDAIAGASSHAIFDLQSGLCKTNPSYTGGIVNIETYPNQWYRCSWTFLATGAGASAVEYQLKTSYDEDASESYLGNGSDGLYLFGAQLELGQVATTYVPTADTNVNTSIASQGYNVEAGIAFSNTRMLQKTSPEVVSLTPITTAGGVSYELGLTEGTYGPAVKQVNDPLSRPSAIAGSPSASPNNVVTFSAAPPPLFTVDALVEVKTTTGSPLVRKVTKITNVSGNVVTLADNVGSIATTTLSYLGMLGNPAPYESTESPSIARYRIVEEFQNYTTSDFSSKNTSAIATRYAVGKDGSTILSANNASVVISDLSVKVPVTTGLLNIGALATRVELEFNNTSPVTIQVSVNGSSYFELSVPSGVNKRTLLSNMSYTWHEISIKSATSDFYITHLLLSGPAKIHVSPDPKLAVIDYVAPYEAPNTNFSYSLGKSYYDILQNSVAIKGAGAFPTWTWSDTSIGLLRVLNTTNEGDTLQFYFVGSGFEIAYLARPDGGAAKVLIDGASFEAISGAQVSKEFASSNRLDTYSSSTDRRLFSVRGLQYGVHKVEIVSDRAARNGSSTDYNLGIFGYSVISNMDVKRTYADNFFNYVADAREFSSFYDKLIGEPAFEVAASDGIKSAYGRLDGSTPAYNMNLSTVLGKTRIELNWTFVYNANPGTAFGELYIHIDGKLVPRYTTGYTAGQAYFKELTANLIELDADYSSTDFDILIVKIAGPTDVNIPIYSPPSPDPFFGAIGDFVYSPALSESQFVAKRDSTWVAADGRNITGSVLHAETGYDTLPTMVGWYVKIN